MHDINMASLASKRQEMTFIIQYLQKVGLGASQVQLNKRHSGAMKLDCM